MTTFVVLVTLSVVILLATIYRYFGKKVESEFYEKLQAQKGQVEIILKNRIALITGKLDNLGADNIVRVTVMLDDKSKLENRITQFYPPTDGVYHFVKKIGEKSIVPQNYPGISRQAIDFVLTEYPNGEVLEDGEKKRVLWWFSAPIMQETSRMGTAYVLYDMVQDTELIETIKQTVDADIFVLDADHVIDM